MGRGGQWRAVEGSRAEEGSRTEEGSRAVEGSRREEGSRAGQLFPPQYHPGPLALCSEC